MDVQTQQRPLANMIPPPLGVPEIEPFDFEKAPPRAVPAEGTILLERVVNVGGTQRISSSGEEPAVPTLGDLSLELPEIGFSLVTPILHVGFDRDALRLDVGLAIDREVTVAIQFTGDPVNGGDRFSPREASSRFLPVNHTVAAEFVASSMTAALALADRTVIRVFGGEITFGPPDLKLREIADLVRNRETARRLMIIGKACDYEFEFPPRLSGEEVQTIAFIHHAIVDRTFVWPMFRTLSSLDSTRDNLELLKARSEPGRIGIPRLIVATLLGHEINLGMVNTVMEDAIIEDVDRVIAEVSKLDGREVETVVRSLAGRATIHCPEAPTLPSNPWTQNEEALMAIENELVTRITDRYNALAASTLEGLTEEQKAELTNPPGPTFAEILNSDQAMPKRTPKRGRRRR